MKCPMCGRELPEEALFCSYCGTKIVKNIKQCPDDQLQKSNEAKQAIIKSSLKRLVVLIIWILFTIAYVWSFADCGRSLGARANSAIEDQLDSYNKSLASVFSGEEEYKVDLNHNMDQLIYYQFHNLAKQYKSTFYVLVITTVIYIVFTIFCYDMIFIKQRYRNS